MDPKPDKWILNFRFTYSHSYSHFWLCFVVVIYVFNLYCELSHFMATSVSVAEQQLKQ